MSQGLLLEVTMSRDDEHIITLVDERLREAKAEIEVLSRAREALVGKPRKVKAAKPKADKPEHKRGRKPSPKRDKVIAMLRNGDKPRNIARHLKVTPAYVYNVRRAM